MPRHLERTQWIASPPLAPGDGPIDLAHLARMSLGDAALEREVLSLFVAQSAKLIAALATLPQDARELAHKLKGSARAIGAFAVADAAAGLEHVLTSGAEPEGPLAALTDAVARARNAIEAILGDP
ncbi:Hpt domain-containing protein [Bradyrhizobium sp. 31Argb]|uniref:Hpt domain-containing protein n=1 Tax=unclassified Bradyrhizobium TaxID=2631580 RepID=UPI00102EC7AE|nr:MULTISPECIES: Hpt domain-containing protein [unclassified Bradyrhizobium]MDI4233099.1 Hpt domain-containing protein [Bradyrhizobium sp. Arg237L]TAI62310.1 histidine kinase [Bradyrhizobium sp. Leo170]